MKRQRKPKKALKVTVTFLGGNVPTARRSRAEVPSVNVSAIRAKTGMSQSAFAASIGVPQGTLINWEQGRRKPSGAAKVLLALLARQPSLMADLYPAPRPKSQWTTDGPDPSTTTTEEMLAEIGHILAVGIVRMREISLRNSSPTMP